MESRLFARARRVVVLLAALACAPVLAPRAFAAWPSDPAVNAPLCVAASDQTLSAVAADGSGGAWFAWIDARNGNQDVYAQHLLSNGSPAPGWPANGLAVCALATFEYTPRVVSDGAGGAFVAWYDRRAGNSDIYAHHLVADGTLDPAWPTNGRAVCTAAGDQLNLTLIADGLGGALFGWEDLRTGSRQVYVHHLLATGTVDPAWPADGRSACGFASAKQEIVLVSDGAGGAIAAFGDTRSGLLDVYASRVLADGTLDPFWPANGLAVSTAAENQSSLAIASDGAGGAVIVWNDSRAGNFDVYAHRVMRGGELYPGWPANGRSIATRSVNEQRAGVVPDGAGGAIVAFRAFDTTESGYDLFAAHVLAGGGLDGTFGWSLEYGSACEDVAAGAGSVSACVTAADQGNLLLVWTDDRAGNYDVYAQWLGRTAALDPGWPYAGRAIGTASGIATQPAVAADGTGGLIACWQESRTSSVDLFAMRVTRPGTFGSPEPVIRGVADVVDDQGGKVHVLWSPALGDGAGLETIERYTVWRRATPASWEFLAAVPARAAPGYALMTATTADSGSSGPAWQVFRVMAHDSSYAVAFVSLPDSGCSRDDLSPAAPAGFVAERDGRVTRLRWDAAADPDHASYRLYRADGPGPDGEFVLVAELRATACEDAAAPPCRYRLTAVDVHGNEGPPALWRMEAAAGTTTATWPYHPLENLLVTSEGVTQYSPAIVPDGAGGAVVFYAHVPTGSSIADIRAQHLLATGRVDPLWPTPGAPVCRATGDRDVPVARARAGGSVVAWQDSRGGNWDIYASYVLASGQIAPGWTANGSPICTAAGNQQWPRLVEASGDGAIIAWTDYRAGNYDVYAQRVSGSGALAWAVDGVAVASGAGSQILGDLAADGSGGAYAAWNDGGTGAVRLHHMLSTGTLDPAWPAGGLQVSAGAAGPQLIVVTGGVIVTSFESGGTLVARRVTSGGAIDPAWPAGGRVLASAGSAYARGVPDGAGGAVIAWGQLDIPQQGRVAAQRVTAAGALATGWPSSGLTLRAGTGDADVPWLVPTADGGAVLAWVDRFRDGAVFDVHAQRVLGTGTLDPAWPSGGRAVCLASGEQYLAGAVSDAAGGLIAAWDDYRAANGRVYAQRVESDGVLGHPEPVITSVADVRPDQGGAVRVTWQASPGESPPFHGITGYTLWRRLTLEGYAASRARGAAAYRAGTRPAPGTVREVRTAAGATFWEYVSGVPASGFADYTVTAATTADSLPGRVTWNVFFVDAQDTSHAMNLAYPSAPDSGYSADDLAPRLPTPCFGFYADGATSLHWAVSAEPDFKEYRLYRGVTRDFPGPAGFVAALTDTGYVDSPGGPFYYFIQTWDVHGNASPNGLIEPAGIAGLPPGPVPEALGLGPAWPNPATGAVMLPLALPRAARVRVTVHDVMARCVRVLADDARPPGTHVLRWDGADARGVPCRSGIYFVRLEAEGRTLHARLARVR